MADMFGFIIPYSSKEENKLRHEIEEQIHRIYNINHYSFKFGCFLEYDL